MKAEDIVEKGLIGESNPPPPPSPECLAVEDALATLADAPPAHLFVRFQTVLLALAAVAFLYYARPVILPLFLAAIAAMALKPIMRGLSFLRIPQAPAAAIIVLIVVSSLLWGFTALDKPAEAWIENAPRNMTDIRSRLQRLFPDVLHLSRAVVAVTDLGATEADKKLAQKTAPTVEVKDSSGTNTLVVWTGSALTLLVEVLVLLYLILASGDLLMLKLVRGMRTLEERKRAVEISHDVQRKISDFLFATSLVNLGVGMIVATGLFFIGVPNPVMWGALAAVLNFVPYFGPTVMAALLAVVGLLTFDTLSKVLIPVGFYFVLHLLESNLVTPILIGRRMALNPLAIFVSLIFWFWLWGVPGALVSVPILVSVKAVCDGLPEGSYIGEIISH
jgi:predicted PurR-regulated permease PerM